MSDITIESPLNTIVNLGILALGFLLYWRLYLRNSQILDRDSISGQKSDFKRKILLIFVTLFYTIGFIMCVLLVITAIVKNLLLASQGLLPNADLASFQSLFPYFDENIARAFLFAFFIPLVRNMILYFGPIYLVWEVIYWSKKKSLNGASKHFLLIARLLKYDQRNARNFLKAVIFIVLIWGLLPGMFFFIAQLPAFSTLTWFSFENDYWYWFTFPSEIVACIYLANYTVREIYESFSLSSNPPKQPSPVLSSIETTNGLIPQSPKSSFLSRSGIRFSKLVNIFYIVLIVYEFILFLYFLFNYNLETMLGRGNFISQLLQLIPENPTVLILSSIFLIFPIDILVISFIQLSLFFKRIFQKELPPSVRKFPRDLLFLTFLIGGYVTFFGWQFIVTYPWMYASTFSGGGYSSSLLQTLNFYPKVVPEKIASFIYLIVVGIQFIKLRKRKTLEKK